MYAQYYSSQWTNLDAILYMCDAIHFINGFVHSCEGSMCGAQTAYVICLRDTVLATVAYIRGLGGVDRISQHLKILEWCISITRKIEIFLAIFHNNFFGNASYRTIADGNGIKPLQV